METVRKRIRREYAPLTVAAEIVCTTPASPAAQVWNSALSEYEPDRTLSPTVIHPHVTASAEDGSWTQTDAGPLLADIVWLVDGTDITTLSGWAGLYSIDTSGGSTRGDLTISRNMPQGEVHELTFRAVIADTRLGLNVPVTAGPLRLTTTQKSGDAYALDIGESQLIQYNAFKDALHRYEYKTSHGLMTASTAAENAAKADVNSYLRTVPLKLYKGKDTVATTGYTVKLHEVTASGTLTQLTAGAAASPEVRAIAPDGITLDLRLVSKRDYVVEAWPTGSTTAAARVQFSVNRICPKFTVRPTNGTDIGPSDTERHDRAMADSDGNVMEVPESVVRIVWKTDTAALKGVEHGEGRSICFRIADTGIGRAWPDDWMDVYCEGSHKPVHSIATDESGDTLTDESGNELIFN